MINPITGVLILLFLLPLIGGAYSLMSNLRVRRAFESLLSSVEFLFGILLSVYLTKKIFFSEEDSAFRSIYEILPGAIRSALYGHDVLTYIFAVPILLAVILVVIRLVTNPLYRILIVPLSDWIYERINSAGKTARRLIGAAWQLPRAAFVVLLFSMLLNFYAYYFPNPFLTRWMNESAAYQLVYGNALYPVLNSGIAKKVPVLFNDSFRNIVQTDGVPVSSSKGGRPIWAGGGNTRVIEYFNGVTLDEAIKSNAEIDGTARNIVGNETDTAKKAQLLYRWISKNIKYDYEKAEKISGDPRGITSGSIDAYRTRKGVCFDYSCLFVSMCRAVGLKVRLVTGLAYSGISWGDHAWNQVYSEEQKRWINVDCTFGSSANYFDKENFWVDHKYDDIQGEW